MNIKWTNEEEEILKNNLNATADEIRIMLKNIGCDKTIKQIRVKKHWENKKLGISKKIPKMNKKGFLNEKIDFILEKLEEKQSISNIAKMLGIRYGQLTNFLCLNPKTKEKLKCKKKDYCTEELNIIKMYSEHSNGFIQEKLSEKGFRRSDYKIVQMRNHLGIKPYNVKNFVANKIKPNEDFVLEMLESGRSITFIASQLGVDMVSLRNYILEVMKLDLSKYSGKKLPHSTLRIISKNLKQGGVYAYISTNEVLKNDIETQKVQILEFAKNQGIKIDQIFIYIDGGTKKRTQEQNIYELVNNNFFTAYDTIIVSELGVFLEKNSLSHILEVFEVFYKIGLTIKSLKEYKEIGITFNKSKMEELLFYSKIFKNTACFIQAKCKKIETQVKNFFIMDSLKKGKTPEKLGVKPYRLLEAHYEEIKILWEKHKSISVISKNFGVGRQSVTNFLNKKGMRVPDPNKVEIGKRTKKQLKKYDLE